MLLYSMLHLWGVRAVNANYDRLGEPSVTLDDIKRFRQLDRKCPGYPGYRWTSGVEVTTGPLGQGVATSVGMAMAGRFIFPQDGNIDKVGPSSTPPLPSPLKSRDGGTHEPGGAPGQYRRRSLRRRC